MPQEKAVQLTSPAKVNLYLEIGARRADGYHEALSIMHTLELCDVVRIYREETSSGGLQISLEVKNNEGIPALDIPAADNLVYQAVKRLAERLGRNQNERIVVKLQKNIPLQAGLGGGSSNAAAALLGAALLWGLPTNDDDIEEVARTLGADVAFFLHGACACLVGVGDVHDHALAPMKQSLCLIKPATGVSTAAAYRAFDEKPVTIASEDRAQAQGARRAVEVPLRNNLFMAAKTMQPDIAQVEAWVDGCRGTLAGLGTLLVSGSGSAVFVCCENDCTAKLLEERARGRGYWACATRFSAKGIEWNPLL